MLAATGVEAQTFRSAVRLALDATTMDEIMAGSEAKALRQDVLLVIKAYKEADEDETKLHPTLLSALLREGFIIKSNNHQTFYPIQSKPLRRVPVNKIFIRGPNPMLFI